MSHPLCPVTGQRAVRHIQWVSADFLAALWRIQFRVDAAPSFGQQERFGTKPALHALAAKGDVTVEHIENVDWDEANALIYWIARCSPIRCSNVHFRDAWSWHAASLFGLLAGWLMRAARKTPRRADEGSGLLLVTRRKG